MRSNATSNGSTTPSHHWMDAYGIKFEERLTVTKAQLELKMRPCFTLKTRIWAYLILHTAGYQGEHAQMMKGGHKTSVQPPDIADALQQSAAKYYRDAGITLDKAALNKLRPSAQDMRRALADMEEDGICERQYEGKALRDMPIKERQAKLNGKIDLYVWLKPRKPEAENVRQEWNSQVSEVPTPEFSNKLIIKYLKSGIPKLSLLLRQLEPAQQERVSEAWRQFAQVVNSCLPEAENQRLPEAVIQSPSFKREEIEEEKLSLRAGGRKDPQQAPTQTEETPARPPEDEFRSQLASRWQLDDDDYGKLCEVLLDTPREDFWRAIQDRSRRGTFGFPIILECARKARKTFELQRQVRADEERRSREAQAAMFARYRAQAKEIMSDEHATSQDREWAEEILSQAEVA
jgi:hypothetical protein